MILSIISFYSSKKNAENLVFSKSTELKYVDGNFYALTLPTMDDLSIGWFFRFSVFDNESKFVHNIQIYTSLFGNILVTNPINFRHDLVGFYYEISKKNNNLPFFEIDLKEDFKFIATNKLSGGFHFYNQGIWEASKDTLRLYEKRYFRVNGFSDEEKISIDKTALQNKGICSSIIPIEHHTNVDSTFIYMFLIQENKLKGIETTAIFQKR